MQVAFPKEGRRPQLRSARSRRTQKMRPLRRCADGNPVEALNMCFYPPYPPTRALLLSLFYLMIDTQKSPCTVSTTPSNFF